MSFELVTVDLQRLLGPENGIRSKFGVLVFHLGLHAVLLYRLSRWLHLHHMDAIAVLITYLNSVLTGAQISRRAIIGKGLAISHPQGVVVGRTAVIGDYCTLVHANSIGQLRGDDDRPIIGDYFYAGAGAKVLGEIKIGNNVRVGANSVVIRSLPDGVSVFGVPAKIILRRPSHPRTTNHRLLSREEIFHRLVSLLKSAVDLVTAIGSLDESTRLLGEGVGLDSIEVLRLVCAIEEEFDFVIDEGELTGSHFETVGSLVTFIHERSAF